MHQPPSTERSTPIVVRWYRGLDIWPSHRTLRIRRPPLTTKTAVIPLVNTNLEQYTIADFVGWNDQKRLELNPFFQRKGVWTPAARTYLIDTILNDLPVPKIYIRTKIDLGTKNIKREVVDGQQRIRTILDFASGKLRLSSRSKKFSGKTYNTLDDDAKTAFLAYALSVDHLMNATDADVLEVFARLNSYGVTLNNQEKRHAEFQGEFRWMIVDAAKEWGPYWDDIPGLTLTNRARMLDHQLLAECAGILIEGVSDGGQAKITKLYKSLDDSFPDKEAVASRMAEVRDFILEHLAEGISSAFCRPPHFLMLFAAVAHMLHGIPQGALEDDEYPEGGLGEDALSEDANENLQFLSAIIDGELEAVKYSDFEEASASSTQRIASRKVRFPVIFDALIGQIDG